MKCSAIALTVLFLLAPIASAQWIPVPDPPDSFQGIELFYPGEDRIYAGTFNGRVFGSTDHADTWTEIAEGLPEDAYAVVSAMVIVGDWFIVSRFDITGENGHNFRSHRDGDVWSTWEPLSFQDGNFQSFAVIGETLFADLFEGSGIYRTDDFGASWTPVVAPSESASSRIFAREGRLFASEQITDGGTVYRSDDLGATWTDIGGGLGSSSYVWSEIFWQGRLLVSVHHGDGDGVFWSSTDFGDSWEEITTLPFSYVVTCMAIAQDGRLAIGTWSGNPNGGTIWLSDDLVDWENYTGNLEFPYWITYSLVAHDGWFYKGGGVNTEFRAPQPGPTAVDGNVTNPAALVLTAHPNPFHPRTALKFDVPRPSHVRLSIHDVAGRLVRTLVNESRSAGRHSVSWEGRDESGRSVDSGVYLLRMEVGDFVTTHRIVRLR
jgi:photosystem II stability/assembly factor-like uncharacterized protein